jgi:hypothetical protein
MKQEPPAFRVAFLTIRKKVMLKKELIVASKKERVPALQHGHFLPLGSCFFHSLIERGTGQSIF